MKKKKIFIIIFILLFVTPILVLLNPITALRANLLMRGLILPALTSEIVEVNNSSYSNVKIYYFKDRPKQKSGAQLGNFQVEKNGVFYSVKYLGNG
ncbi:MAG: hypothetical protein E7E64_16395 [Clostridium celatum]|jgi:hypothetical protein|uniref:hypothetical protein n=1 Tax=Clostridium tertium TaxID=1559 RepID=UPI0018AC5139|nr:hypothetical protein [Clostridium tertium]MDU0937665.1 hypothetical protein [Dermabacter sp.]MDU1476665.1 hypothetical protein [Clostridium perfringens]MDU2124085.1 hypothetical protein [Clostridium celatum]